MAAEFVMKRVQGVTVTAHFKKIQDMDAAFYRKFQIVVLGLDSIEGASGCATLRPTERATPRASRATSAPVRTRLGEGI